MRNFVFIVPPPLSAKLSTAVAFQNNRSGFFRSGIRPILPPVVRRCLCLCFSKTNLILSALPKAFAQPAGRSEPPQKTRFRPHSENPGISDFPTACFQQVTDAKIIITDVIT